MAEYVKAMDITWPIAFAKEDVFNPDFGVRGIPHVAIIGADGKTAYNNLDPRDPMTEKVKKINGLLMKAGLPHPQRSKVDREEQPRKVNTQKSTPPFWAACFLKWS